MDSLTDLMPAASALGVGLMIGLERERKKGEGEQRAAIGLRTCAVTAVLGYVAITLGGITLLAVVLLALGVLLAASYLRARRDDPGLTTEVALLLTACLGGLCVREPATAVALAVVLTALLALREPLHHFARRWISEREVRDGLILATAALVILPLLPNRFMGPYEAINPYEVWRFTVLLMAISALGHLAVRLLGSRHGLALAGFISGFASSTATIATMGAKARARPDLLLPCAAAAVLSTVATLAQMALILLAADPPLLMTMRWPLLGGIAAALLFAAVATRQATSGNAGAPDTTAAAGSVFNLRLVLMLGLAIALISLLSAALLNWLGEGGVTLATALAGLADAHSPAVSVATLTRTGHLHSAQAVWPLLAALSTNTLSKAMVAWTSGGPAYFWRVMPGLGVVLAALWAGAALSGP